MNAIQYDAVVVGNHEFNYGLATLDRAKRQADFPLLAANVYTPGGHRRYGALVDLDATRHQGRDRRRDDARLDGLGPRQPRRQGRHSRHRARRARGGPRRAQRRRRRRDRGRALRAQRAVELRHRRYGRSPSENVAARLAHEVPGIDLMVYGHSHKEMADTRHRHHAADAAQELGDEPRRRASARRAQRRRVGAWWRSTVRSSSGASPRRSRSCIAVTQEGHRAAIRYATTPIGTTAVALARRLGARRRHAAHGLHARGGAPSVGRAARIDRGVRRSTPTLDAGPITVARLSALYPYDNTLRAVKIIRRAAPRVSRAERALLSRDAKAARSTSIRRSPATTTTSWQASTTRSTSSSPSASASRRSRSTGVRSRDGHLHARAQQLSADGRRRLRHAARRARRVRPPARDSPTADRRSRGASRRFDRPITFIPTGESYRPPRSARLLKSMQIKSTQ